MLKIIVAAFAGLAVVLTAATVLSRHSQLGAGANAEAERASRSVNDLLLDLGTNPGREFGDASLVFAGIARMDANEVSLLQHCRKTFTDSGFDCACPVEFLDKLFDRSDAELIFSLWAWSYSLDGRSDHSADFANLDSRYGHERIIQVLLRFNHVRMKLFTQCPRFAPEDANDY